MAQRLSPLALYLDVHRLTQDSAVELDRIRGGHGFLEQLTNLRHTQLVWIDGPAFSQNRDDAAFEEAVEIASKARAGAIAWSVLGILQKQATTDERRAKLVAAYEELKGHPFLAYAARYEGARLIRAPCARLT